MPVIDENNSMIINLRKMINKISSTSYSSEINTQVEEAMRNMCMNESCESDINRWIYLQIQYCLKSLGWKPPIGKMSGNFESEPPKGRLINELTKLEYELLLENRNK